MSFRKILFNGNQFAQRCLDDTANAIRKELSRHSDFYALHPELAAPRLDIINIGFNAASLSYIKKKISIASYLGINLKLHQFVERGHRNNE
jgi:5,10-methylene-tetrahydrofolate dehydrogenase/methenyl tetrahydrofolate cyclohydrolase